MQILIACSVTAKLKTKGSTAQVKKDIIVGAFQIDTLNGVVGDLSPRYKNNSTFAAYRCSCTFRLLKVFRELLRASCWRSDGAIEWQLFVYSTCSRGKQPPPTLGECVLNPSISLQQATHFDSRQLCPSSQPRSL